jgi:hypothetical protein
MESVQARSIASVDWSAVNNLFDIEKAVPNLAITDLRINSSQHIHDSFVREKHTGSYRIQAMPPTDSRLDLVVLLLQ